MAKIKKISAPDRKELTEEQRAKRIKAKRKLKLDNKDKETYFKKVKTKKGNLEYRLLLEELSARLEMPLNQIALSAGLNPSLFYFLISGDPDYRDRVPKIDVIFKILDAFNNIAEEKNIKKFTLEDLFEKKYTES